MHILVVEDDPELCKFVAGRLAEAGHRVAQARSGEDAVRQEAEAVCDAPFDAVVLDRMLPGLSGIDVLRHWRSAGNKIPVLLLTALDGIDDRVDGLEAGADDYVGKPFAFAELVARLNAITRRKAGPEMETCFEKGPIALDLLKREVRCNGKIVILQPREFRLLEVMLRNAGQTVTRQMLLEDVWGFRFDPQTSIVETHMSRLRGKLGDGGAPVYMIETVRGVGYRLRTDG